MLSQAVEVTTGQTLLVILLVFLAAAGWTFGIHWLLKAIHKLWSDP